MSKLDIGYWVLGIGYWVLGFGYWVLGIEIFACESVVGGNLGNKVA